MCDRSHLGQPMNIPPDKPDDPPEYIVLRAFLSAHGRHPKHRAEFEMWLHELRDRAKAAGLSETEAEAAWRLDKKQ